VKERVEVKTKTGQIKPVYPQDCGYTDVTGKVKKTSAS